MAENRVLLVEGTDDLHVLAHIFKAHGHEGKITIREQEGVDRLKKRLGENLFDNHPKTSPLCYRYSVFNSLQSCS